MKLSHTLNELHPLPAPPGSHGHEAVGRVVQVGRKVRDVREGDQVVRINLVADRDWDMRCFAEYPLARLQQALEDLESHPEWRRALIRVTG